MSGMKTPTPDPDVELMLRVRIGDEAAFQALFRRHAAPLVGFVDRFFHNRAQSEEVVQEVFLKVYRARKRYEPRAKFTTWLYTIATRACLNEVRRNRPRRTEPLEDDPDTAAAGTVPAADQMLEGRRLQELVERVLDRMPDSQRAAMLLVRFGACSYAEAAQILKTTEPAVKSLLFRATDELRQALEARRREELGLSDLPWKGAEVEKDEMPRSQS